MDYTDLGPNQEVNENGLIYEVDSLYAYLGQIKDTRKAQGKQYPLVALLVLMLLAKLAGEDKPSGIAEWVAHRVEQWVEMKILTKPQAPSHMTYRRVLANIVSADEFERLVGEFHRNRLVKDEQIVYRMDGKALKGTIPRGEMRGTHLLSLYVAEQGLVVGETAVERKENEISAAPELLEQVDLKEAIVIADAMHTQRQPSSQIVEAGGDYVLTAKGNQPRTEWAIQKLFVHEVCNLRQGAPLSPDCQMAQQTGKGHGRIETRTIMTSTQLNEYLDWPHVSQVFRLERTVQHSKYKGKTRQIIYGLTSLSPEEAPPKKMLSLLRNYWAIENGLHYRRDVTLHEDATRLTVGAAGHIMAILNNLVIGLSLQDGFDNLAQARRLYNAKPFHALQLILSPKSPFL